MSGTMALYWLVEATKLVLAPTLPALGQALPEEGRAQAGRTSPVPSRSLNRRTLNA